MGLRVDVFVDNFNRNYVWIIVTSKNNKLSRKKEQIIRFDSYQAYSNYAHQFLQGAFFYEHNIDYARLEYYSHNFDHERDYITLKYNEYINGVKTPKKMRFDKDLEKELIEILRVNKKIPYFMPMDSRYYQYIDVEEEAKRKRQETIQTIRMSLNEFFALAGEKINIIKNNRYIVKGLKIFAIATISAGLLQGGYTLYKNNEMNSEYIIQTNALENLDDIPIYANKGKMGIMLGKLLKREYEEIDENDLKSLFDFLKKVEDSNYDNNSSFNLIKFNDLELNAEDYVGLDGVLEKIDKLYQRCFSEKGNKHVLNEQAAHKYIDYVLSLTVMYDVYNDTRPSQVNINYSSVSRPFANSEELRAYNKLPPILKYMILNQLKSIMLRSDYHVETEAGYTFKENDKYSLIGNLNVAIDSVVEELNQKCSTKTENKTI